MVFGPDDEATNIPIYLYLNLFDKAFVSHPLFPIYQ